MKESVMRRTVLLLTAVSLGACGGGGNNGGSPPPPPMPPAPPGPTIDLMPYLVQSRTPNGDVSQPLRASDPLTYRRLDSGNYQITDSFLAPDSTAITALTFIPFSLFNATRGDGGDQYVVEGDTARAAATQDGGTPGVQYFVGKACGGEGWVLFKSDADASWKSLVAHLSDSPNPTACPPLGAAYTRYIRQPVTYPNLGVIDSLVTEHYDRDTIANSRAAERMFFGYGWGRLVWQAWGPTPSVVDLSTRCPDFGWNTPPVDGWYLEDCREAVNIIPADATLTGAQEWHP